ncbi:MAG: nucleotidyl transferase AbiEii/AbiGii toxin family protein [Microbacterium sp.]|uniref:nucleotidyl transferase AbiEii/AbiGii toxin family protein n=1 Tax=Microbacterium sp. TaxID=51671 RepID=UPI003F94CB4E
MIPQAFVTEWGANRPWPTLDQIEQDLLLSRAMCKIAEHPLLGDELVFRGGTALHKVHLPEPLRYSEDLDYVRTSAGGIGDITGGLLDLGRELGFDVASRISAHPKVYWRTTSAAGGPLRLKIEVNTHERSPALPVVKIPHTVESSWWSGSGELLTFQPPELIATKLRALFQRSKGRDLFDLWLALTQIKLEPDSILSAFQPYRPAEYTARRAVSNLREKITTARFRADLRPLVSTIPAGYELETAAGLVITKLLEKIE